MRDSHAILRFSIATDYTPKGYTGSRRSTPARIGLSRRGSGRRGRRLLGPERLRAGDAAGRRVHPTHRRQLLHVRAARRRDRRLLGRPRVSGAGCLSPRAVLRRLPEADRPALVQGTFASEDPSCWALGCVNPAKRNQDRPRRPLKGPFSATVLPTPGPEIRRSGSCLSRSLGRVEGGVAARGELL